MPTRLAFAPQQSSTATDVRKAQFEMRFPVTTDETTRCYEMRFRAYEAYLPPEDRPASGAYRDSFDDLTTTVLLGAYDSGRLVGNMRLCFSRPGESLASLPCASHYPALRPVKASAPGGLMEVSRVAIDPAIKNTSYRTTLYASLVRLGFLAAEAAGVSTILIATRSETERFYRYMLGFSVIGEPAFYPPGDFKITLLGGSLSQARLRQRAQNAFFRITPEEVASMRRALDLRLRLPAVA